MRKEVTDLIQAARTYFGVSKTAAVVSDFVLASAMAHALPLPSSAVSDPKVYYAEHAAKLVLRTADYASRYSLVSVNRIVSLAQTLWIARYQSVYAPAKFGVLFGLPVGELGDPELAEAVETGDLKAFLLKRDRFIQPACDAVVAFFDGLSVADAPTENTVGG